MSPGGVFVYLLKTWDVRWVMLFNRRTWRGPSEPCGWTQISLGPRQGPLWKQVCPPPVHRDLGEEAIGLELPETRSGSQVRPR